MKTEAQRSEVTFQGQLVGGRARFTLGSLSPDAPSLLLTEMPCKPNAISNTDNRCIHILKLIKL